MLSAANEQYSERQILRISADAANEQLREEIIIFIGAKTLTAYALRWSILRHREG